ncbi:ABC-2 family transporter protein [bacterium BMS3Abin03]|nr:ABC-2 family transporter protein [bacterium BMS3Abin03]
MHKTLIIAKWEYLEKIKTKAFVLSLVVTPLIIILFSVLPALLSQKEDMRTKVIGVVDTSGVFFNGLQKELEEYRIDNNQPNYVLINLSGRNKNLAELKSKADKDVLDKAIEGYMLILNAGTDSLKVDYRSEKIGSFKDLKIFNEKINKLRVQHELRAKGLNPEVADILQNNVEINLIKIEKSGEDGRPDFMVVFFSSFIFILLLMMMVIYSGQMLVRSLIEEKSNRIIEILISSCKPEELLAGKILGLSALGLTQILIWSLIAVALIGGAVIPPSAFENILPMLLYFILGFLFYTTIFVGVGSIVNTEQEAQQFTTYISLLLILPVVFTMPAIENPDSLLIKILTYIPLTSPSIMLLRLKIAPVPLSDIIITLAIISTSTLVMIKIAAKIFRIGILSYGTKPSLKELIQWIKEK